MKKADAILTADLHFRDDVPKCRTDDFHETMKRKMRFITDLAYEHQCPVFVAGDIFHKWKPSPWLLSFVLENWDAETFAVLGQHDLPQHNAALWAKSGARVLSVSGFSWNVIGPEGVAIPEGFLNGFWWEQPIEDRVSTKQRTMTLLHKYVCPDAKPHWAGDEALHVDEVLDKLSSSDLIVTGDNHAPFVHRRGNQLLVNPGSLMRQTADQMNHTPQVYLWYAEENDVVAEYLPIDEQAVTRDHIDEVEQRSERLGSFVSRLDREFEVGLSFRRNLREFLSREKIKKAVSKHIWEVFDG
jgi:DNA repair exonuclease SbcCD nuclease subunit